jgi:hypothetical protein
VARRSIMRSISKLCACARETHARREARQGAPQKLLTAFANASAVCPQRWFRWIRPPRNRAAYRASSRSRTPRRGPPALRTKILVLARHEQNIHRRQHVASHGVAHPGCIPGYPCSASAATPPALAGRRPRGRSVRWRAASDSSERLDSELGRLLGHEASDEPDDLSAGET